MELDQIKKHWDNKAKTHKTSLLSTTKTSTIKKLEINAFIRVLRRLCGDKDKKSVLEVGCGNGYNLFGLEEAFPDFEFYGLDYSEDMVAAANAIKNQKIESRVSFRVADVTNLDTIVLGEKRYDFVLTDRLLINLNTWELQQEAIRNLFSVVTESGYLIMIENFENSYANQNQLRGALGLSSRTPDQYNTFIDEREFENFVVESLDAQIESSINFGSLHDILLYVLVPHFNGGKTLYDHPILDSVTKLIVNLPDECYGNFGNFGQNNLYVLKKCN